MKKLPVLVPVLLLIGCAQKEAPTPVNSLLPAGGAVAQTQPASPLGSREMTRPEPVRVPAGTALRVRTTGSIDTARNGPGDHFTATLDQPLMSGDRVVAPRGTEVTGRVTQSGPSGRLKGRAVLGVTLDSIRLNGRNYPIATNSSVRVSAAHKKRNLAFIGGGSGLGAAIGAIAGGAKGALIGAGAGAAAGTAGAATTGKRNVAIPAESLLTFSLRCPLEL